MAKKIIKISVNDEYVLGSGAVIGAEGADESVVLRVAFNDTWAGLNIYVTFRDAFGENPEVEMLMPSMLVAGELMTYDVPVRAKATAVAGKMSLVFSGFEVSTVTLYDPETDSSKLVYRDAVINTGNAYFRVLPSDFSALDAEDKPEAKLFETVLAEINNLHGDIVEHVGLVQDEMLQHEEDVEVRMTAAEAVVTQLRKEADEGKFKGEPGEPGPMGETGPQGKAGEDFRITKIYSSIAEMEDDFGNETVPVGRFVLIDTGNVEDEDNAKIFVKGESRFQYIADLSGKAGIQGPKGDPYKLTDRDRDDIAGVVYEKHFGDIGAALDEVISLQNSILGIITFTLYWSSIDITHELEAEKDMTWAQWCESEYNTIGAYIISGRVYHDYDGERHTIYREYSFETTFAGAEADDTLTDGHVYKCVLGGV